MLVWGVYLVSVGGGVCVWRVLVRGVCLVCVDEGVCVWRALVGCVWTQVDPLIFVQTPETSPPLSADIRGLFYEQLKHKTALLSHTLLGRP